MSSRPNRSSTLATIVSGAPASVRSPATAKARSPSSRASASARSGSRTFTATDAPRAMRRSAAARPSPRAAPVIRATRPPKSSRSEPGVAIRTPDLTIDDVKETCPALERPQHDVRDCGACEADTPHRIALQRPPMDQVANDHKKGEGGDQAKERRVFAPQYMTKGEALLRPSP